MPSLPPTGIAVMKRSVRKAQLHYLRRWARACPAQASAESEQVSEKLFELVKAEYVRGGRARPVSCGPLFVCAYLPLYYEVDLRPLFRRLWRWQQEQATAPAAVPTTTATTTQAAAPFTRDLCLMVPVVLDAAAAEAMGLVERCGPAHTPVPVPVPTKVADAPLPVPFSSSVAVEVEIEHALSSASVNAIDGASAWERAMVFVEVRDEADLDASFEESGTYRILELKRPIFQRFFRRHTEAVPPPVDAAPPRRILLCDSWSRLFPAFRRPPGLVCWPDESAQAHTQKSQAEADTCAASSLLACDHVNAPTDGLGGTHGDAMRNVLSACVGSQLLVLAPGVRFDAVSGARLGKGGGFYDRFLRFHGDCCRQSARADSSGPASSGARGSADGSQKCERVGDTVRVVGVCFRAQLTGGEDAEASAAGVDSLSDGAAEVARLPVPHDPATDMNVDTVASPDGCVTVRGGLG